MHSASSSEVQGLVYDPSPLSLDPSILEHLEQISEGDCRGGWVGAQAEQAEQADQ